MKLRKMDFTREDVKGTLGVMRRVNEMACGGLLLTMALDLSKSSMFQIATLLLLLLASILSERFERRTK